MNLIDTHSLARGAMAVDFAFADAGRRLEPSIPECIGIVAACLNRGIYPGDMERELTARINSAVGERAKDTFDFFNCWRGEGLWMQGPAIDHIELTNKRLQAMFPKVSSHFGIDLY